VSLRLKLLIAVIVLVFAGLTVADVVTYTSLRSFLFQRVDQQLKSSPRPVAFALNQAAHGDPFPGGNDLASLPPGTFGEVRDLRGTILTKRSFVYGPSSPPEPDLRGPLPRTDASTEPGLFTTGALGGSSLRYRVLVQDVFLQPGGQHGVLIVAIPLSEIRQTLGRLVAIELLVSGAVLLGLGFLSWWLVRRGLRPLEEIGVTAGAIAAGDLTRRVEPTDERTEIGRLGVALNAMLAQIEAAFEERRASESRLRRFVADASHELRTPLTSIRGYAELFRRGADSRPDDLAKSMQRIEAEASRMGLLVDDLLLLARLDQGRPLEREPVDVAKVAADAVESARAIEPDRPITVRSGGPAFVLGDEARLRQVADNLLDNARVHTQPGTSVDVSVESISDRVVLSVADRGPGMPSEVAARVFERFYRGDPARSRGTGGVGLGLSIVSAIVDAHGGTVTCSSPEGAGATFEVSLPARRIESSAPPAGAAEERVPEGQGTV
jgi:two-component system OmpR family sensor kinase